MSLLTAALIVLIQVATGSLLILLIPSSRIRSKFEIVGLGLALGTFISLLSSVALVNTPLHSVAWAIPAIVVALVSVIRISFIRSRLREITLPRNESIAVVVGLIIGLALLVINWVRVPLGTIRSGGSVDMFFFEALSKGVSEFGAASSILMSGGSLRYHWFSYGWAGELTQVAGLDSFVALTRILPVVALIGVVFLAASWSGAIRIGKKDSPWWVPSLAVILIVFAGYTGALYGVVLNLDSPSQAFTSVWLLGLVILFMRGIRSESRFELLIYFFLVLLMAGATTGGKASHAVVALGGFAFVVMVGAVLHQHWWRRALILFTAATIGAVAVYFWALSGVGLEANLAQSIAVRASTWQGLDPIAGRWGPLLGTVALLLAVLTRLSGAGWLAVNKAGRRSPEFSFVLGALGVGVVALFVLRGGINELWFLLAASAPIAVISAYGVGQAQKWLNPRLPRALIISFVIAALASILSLILSLNWVFASPPNEFFQWPGILYWLSVTGVWAFVVLSSWLVARHFTSQGGRLGTLIAVVGLSATALTLTSVLTRPAVLWTESRPLTTDIGVVTPDLVPVDSTSGGTSGGDPASNLADAAEWVVANTERSDLIATNAPVSAFIPALTGNQMYLAGFLYQAGLGDISQLAEVNRRSEISGSLSASALTDPSQAEVLQELCGAGVAYLWIEGPERSDVSQALYSNASVSIYAVESQCIGWSVN